MNYDTVLSDCLVVDGTGGLPYEADIAIDGGRIAAIGKGLDFSARNVINAKGKAVAPGFLDFHSHSEWIVPSADHAHILLPLLMQGVTTIIGGNCGFSPFPVDRASADTVLSNSRFLTGENFKFEWESTTDFLARIEKNGSLLNVGSLVGHGTLRALLVGNRPGKLDRNEVLALCRVAAQAMEEGALGVSFGLAYVPGIFADEDELEALFRIVAASRGIITVHGRTYSWTSPFYGGGEGGEAHNVRDVRFFLELARRTGARLNLSHLLLKGSSTWGTLPEVLGLIDAARGTGVDVTFGVIPYHWGNTLINTLLPKWFLEDFGGNVRLPGAVAKLKKELEETERSIGRDPSDIHLLWGGVPELQPYEGMSLDRIAESIGRSTIDTTLFVMEKSAGKAKILTASYSGREGVDEGPLDALLSHPSAICEIDTIVTSSKGPHNPATFGAYPKLLGRYARSRSLFPLQTAVRKITGLPADRLGIPSIGYLKPGYRADLVMFDPSAITDTNTIEHPDLPPKGIERVLIAGKTILENGRLTDGPLAGEVLRKI